MIVEKLSRGSVNDIMLAMKDELPTDLKRLYGIFRDGISGDAYKTFSEDSWSECIQADDALVH